MKYSHKNKESVASSTINYLTTEGAVSRFFEGTSTLSYSFEIPTTATTGTDMNGALIKVTDKTNPIASIYMSYEGARGYMPLDYIHEVVAPHVSVITTTGTSTIGSYDWTTAETTGSEWYIASVDNGNWLVVMEGKKASDLYVKHILETVNVVAGK